MPKPTIAALQARIAQLESKQPSRIHESHSVIARLGIDRYMGSGLVLQINDLSGKVLVKPTLIHDGLTDKTIAALENELSSTLKFLTETYTINPKRGQS